VRALIYTSVPTIDALEVLLLLVREPGRARSVAEIAQDLEPTILPEAHLREYLALLQSQGLVQGTPDSGFAYRPVSEGMQAAVDGLRLAYEKKPVTLIRTVYAIADAKKVQAFADAFRLRKDP
jgi:hypothetical protein